MGITAAIGVAVIAGAGSAAVSANQQKIAAQKQSDAVGDAQKAQDKMLADQRAADAQRKQKEDSAVQQGFAVAASNRRAVSGGDLPGAAPNSSIGNPGNAANAAKTLIGG